MWTALSASPLALALADWLAPKFCPIAPLPTSTGCLLDLASIPSGHPLETPDGDTRNTRVTHKHNVGIGCWKIKAS